MQLRSPTQLHYTNTSTEITTTTTTTTTTNTNTTVTTTTTTTTTDNVTTTIGTTTGESVIGYNQLFGFEPVTALWQYQLTRTIKSLLEETAFPGLLSVGLLVWFKKM